MNSRAGKGWRQVVIGLLLGGLVLPAAAVGAQSSGGIGSRVANTDSDNPRAQSIFIYELDHGEVVHDQLLVLNETDSQQTIAIGSVDATVSVTGEFACREESEPRLDIGGWVKLSASQLVLDSGEEALVDFSVTVPDKADVGDHNGCLTVRQAYQEGEDAGGGIRIFTRQGVRMIVTVPGELHREVGLEGFTVGQTDRGEQYSLVVSNRGNVSVDVDMQINLSSLSGRKVASSGGTFPILPDETMQKQFETSHRPMLGGWYEATASVRYDKRLGTFGTQDKNAEYETIVGEPVGVFLWPTLRGWLTIIGGTTSLILGCILLINHRREKHLLRKNARAYTVNEGDTLQGVARLAEANWRDIVSLNRLRAPYSLNPGEKILLPALKPVMENKKTTKKGK